MSKTILKMTGITKRFGGVNVLDGVDFILDKGEVHALLGENGAGKSTLMKILLGLYARDDGKVEFLGEEVFFHEPSQALTHGISMVHQEISVIPTMSVAENIWLGREDQFKRGFFLNLKKRNLAAKELLDSLDIELDPNKKLKDLSVAQMQLVEIARSVSYDSKIIIMDEPTSALTDVEVRLLFKIIRNLSEKGVSIIFISHKIEEILEICDTITILRDGEFIARKSCQGLDQDELIKLIVGRDMKEQLFERQATEYGDTVLEVKNLAREGVFKDINFSVRAGEIVGFSGLMGAGRTEVVRAVFGLDEYSSGEIIINGKKEKITSPQDAMKCGIAMVTEDRLRSGIIPPMSVELNSTIANLDEYCNKIGFVNGKEEKKEFNKMSQDLSVKYHSMNDLIITLSGGNQQKVILSRWLLTKPKVLILDEPTRGIDIGAKHDIYKLMNRLSHEGMAIVFVSSEMPELLAMCDRIFVMRNGKISGQVMRDEATQDILGRYAFGI
jgi:ABC-type sugar transport system ATPase subunit